LPIVISPLQQSNRLSAHHGDDGGDDGATHEPVSGQEPHYDASYDGRHALVRHAYVSRTGAVHDDFRHRDSVPHSPIRPPTPPQLPQM
jgi:hypothetical protein